LRRIAVQSLVLSLVLALSACAEPVGNAARETDPQSGATRTVTPTATPKPESPATDPPPPSGTKQPSAQDGTRLIVDDSEFGRMLYASSGQAIYLFDLESSSLPRCYDACAAAWPPVLTKRDPGAGQGVRQGLLGTVERADGTHQVTYGGHPLYFYAHEDPWQVLCHDFGDFGGTWLVVRPDGEAAR
jgi:predicted lipoprotein with Yx(FWY)xxD motif